MTHRIIPKPRRGIGRSAGRPGCARLRLLFHNRKQDLLSHISSTSRACTRVDLIKLLRKATRMPPRSVSEGGASILDPCCGRRSNVCSLRVKPVPAAAPLTHVATLTRSPDTVWVSGDSCDADGPAFPQVNHACRLPPPGLLL